MLVREQTTPLNLVVAAGMVTNTIIKGVMPGEQFSISLRAVNSVGSGEWVSIKLENVVSERLKKKIRAGKGVKAAVDDDERALETKIERMNQSCKLR